MRNHLVTFFSPLCNERPNYNHRKHPGDMQTVIKTLGSFGSRESRNIGRIQASILSLTQAKCNILQMKPENLSSPFCIYKGVK